MKRFSIGLLIGLLIGVILTIPMYSLAQQPIKLIINGQQIQCDVPPQNINGRVLVPARFVAEPLGATVEWDGINRVVKIMGKSGKQNHNNSQQDNLIPPKNTHPLRLDSVSETTYKPLNGTNEKYAYVTVTITNTTDKYIPFIRLTPILNVNDGRSYMSALDPSTELEGGYYKPNSSITLKYWALIPNEITIIDWKMYD